MHNKILLNLKHVGLENELLNFQPFISLAHSILHQGRGKGSEFLGWLNLPDNFNINEFKTIQTCAQKIKNDSEALVVIGIGGSYQGAKAAIEMLSHSFHNLLPKNKRPGTEIYFAGQNISATYLKHLLELLAEKDFSINVISKSGTTTEPAIAFRLLRNLLKKKYGEKEARKRIYATTDKDKGALRKLATEESYQTFIVPNDIGGRYSVLTPVGLLPIAAAGIDISELMAGAKQAMVDLQASNLEQNDCYSYAAARQLLYRKGKQIELLVSYEPSMQSLADWWKQLFGESEGKDGTGIYPSTASFSTDLHSLGQYIQDGPRHLFETIINIEQSQCNLLIPAEKDDLDGLNYLADKTIDFVNKKALQGTMLAHSNDQIPNLLLSIPEKTPFFLGYLFYFFEKACAISSYLSGVNPFDQPGVEAYKKNMFALLGKPGYETLKATLEKGLHF